MSETERLARLLHLADANNERRPGRPVPRRPLPLDWRALLGGEANRYLALAAAVLAAGYVPPGVPRPTESGVPS